MGGTSTAPLRPDEEFGGVEYLVFWGVASLAIAVHEWKKVWSTEQGFARLTVAHA